MRFTKVLLIAIIFIVASACAQKKVVVPYTVKKGETIKSIAKKLDIKTRELLRLNPDVSRRPKPNTVIVIPKRVDDKKLIDKYLDKEKDNKKDTILANKKIDTLKTKEEYLTHKVAKGDTFFNLTRRYNVSENQLKELNPLLKEGLKLDMILKIKPLEEDLEEEEIYKDVINKTDISIALLLPFRAKEYDSIPAEAIFNNNTLANITTDLYLGADLALDSLKTLGINPVMDYYDTGRKNEKIDSLLSAINFDKYDAIIGPLYSEEIPEVARSTKTPIVFPVYSKNQDEFRYRQIVKTFPDIDDHDNELLEHIKKYYNKENLIIVGDSSSISIRKANRFKNEFSKLDSLYSVKVIHPTKGYIPKENIINALDSIAGNWVVMATNERIIASDIVNSLISFPVKIIDEEPEDEDDKNKNKKKEKPTMQFLPETTVIKLFASNKSTSYNLIDNYKLAKLGFTFTSDSYININSDLSNQFNKQYIKKNNTYPSYYATKGFDVVYDIVIRLASGKDLKDTFKEGISKRIESKFNYTKELFQSTSNKGIYILEYNPDLTIKKVR